MTSRQNAQDTLFLALVVAIGAGLVMTGVYAFRIVADPAVSDIERVEYRNTLVMHEIGHRLVAARLAVAQALGSAVVDAAVVASTADRATEDRLLLERLNADRRFASWREWLILDTDQPRIGRLEAGELRWTAVSQLPSVLPDATTPMHFALLFDPTEAGSWSGGLDLAILLDAAVDSPWLGRPRILILRSNLELSSTLVDEQLSLVTHPVLVDGDGREIARLQGGLPVVGSPSGACDLTDSFGICDPALRLAHLGTIGEALRGTHAPSLVQRNGTLQSVIPAPGADAFLVVTDYPTPVSTRLLQPLVSIAVPTLVLYAIIVWLFVSLRRTVNRQTTSLQQAAFEKNVVLSLLSHNLKNNLAAIAAEAYAVGATGRLLEAVGDAARVVSNSLYYLQLREGRFGVPPIEPVDLQDLVEFLMLRLQQKADHGHHQLVAIGTETAAVVRTNVNLTIDALEQITVNALQHAPAGTAVELAAGNGGNVAWLTITDHGTGIDEQQQRQLFEPFGQERSTNGRGEADAAPVARSASHSRTLVAGLGLFVARELLASVGASLELERTGSSGTQFVIRFPLAGDTVVYGG